MEKRRYLTIQQAHAYFGFDKLGLSTDWLYSHWREIRGCFKIGGAVLVDRDMVEQYFRELASSAKAEGKKSAGTDTRSDRHGLLR